MKESHMEFENLTTDLLLAALPIDREDDRWELKSAQYLDPSKRGELKKELGKQVSAFANSGGGYLVFGLSNDRKLEACDVTVGRQPMKDFLGTMVEQSVEYALDVCDYAYIMDEGRVKAGGLPDEIKHSELRKAYLGV